MLSQIWCFSQFAAGGLAERGREAASGNKKAFLVYMTRNASKDQHYTETCYKLAVADRPGVSGGFFFLRRANNKKTGKPSKAAIAAAGSGTTADGG
jgi:hypothetical protein